MAGSKKLTVNPTTGKLDFISIDSGEYIPLSGTLTDNLSEEIATTSITRINASDIEIVTPTPHGIDFKDIVSIRESSLSQYNLISEVWTIVNDTTFRIRVSWELSGHTGAFTAIIQQAEVGLVSSVVVGTEVRYSFINGVGFVEYATTNLVIGDRINFQENSSKKPYVGTITNIITSPLDGSTKKVFITTDDLTLNVSNTSRTGSFPLAQVLPIEKNVTGNITLIDSPLNLPYYEENTLITKGVLETHSLDQTNPHGVDAADVSLDNLTNDKQIPITGTVQVGVIVLPFSLNNISSGNPPGLVEFTIAGGHPFVLSQVVTVTGTSDWDSTYTITELSTGGDDDVFTAQAAPGFHPSGGSNFDWNYYYSTSGSFSEATPAEPVTGNIQFTSEPSGLPGFDRLSAINAGYVDDSVAANNELSEVLANGNTTAGEDIVVDPGDLILLNGKIQNGTGGFGNEYIALILEQTGISPSDIDFKLLFNSNEAVLYLGTIDDSLGFFVRDGKAGFILNSSKRIEYNMNNSVEFVLDVLATANRTQSYQDADGIIALTTDVGQSTLSEVLANGATTGGIPIVHDVASGTTRTLGSGLIPVTESIDSSYGLYQLTNSEGALFSIDDYYAYLGGNNGVDGYYGLYTDFGSAGKLASLRAAGNSIIEVQDGVILFRDILGAIIFELNTDDDLSGQHTAEWGDASALTLQKYSGDPTTHAGWGARSIPDKAYVDAQIGTTVLEAETTTASMSFVIDEDDMSSDLATKIPTQQSVKKYVDDRAKVWRSVNVLLGAVKTHYITIPTNCTLTRIDSVVFGTTATALETLTTKNHAGTGITGGVVSIANGAIAKEVDTASPSANNTFTAGEVLTIDVGGENSNSVECEITFEFTL